MSASRGPKGSWLSQNYEKLATMIVLVGLLVSALVLVLRIGFERRALVGGVRPTVTPSAAGPVELAAYQPEVEKVRSPFQSSAYSNDLVVSEVRVWSVNSRNILAPIPYNAPICPFSGEPQPPVIPETERDSDNDGLRNEYERQQGLDPLDPTDALLDKDDDGFSNVEELQFGSDLADPKSFPDLTAKLRVVGTRTIPFVFRFQGVQELPDGNRFLLNLRTLEQSYFVKLGEEIKGFGFKVLRFDPEAPDGPTLTLQKGNDTVDLVKGRRVDKAEVMALMVFLLDESTYRVRVDDEIKIKERAYKIVDIGRNAVSIRDVESGKFYQIGMLTESERAELLGLRAASGVGTPADMGVTPEPERRGIAENEAAAEFLK